MNYCFVNEIGEMICIPQEDRDPFEGEFKVLLDGYYEALNFRGYPKAIWDFDIKAWVGAGEPMPIPTPEVTLTIEERARLLEEVVNAFMEGGM